MKRRQLFLLFLIFKCVGCGSAPKGPEATSAKSPSKSAAEQTAGSGLESQSPADAQPGKKAKTYDTSFMLDGLRLALESIDDSNWSIAKTPVTWSTLTVDLSSKLNDQSADKVWKEWTTPISALTKKPDSDGLKKLIKLAVSEAKGGKQSLSMKFRGFQIEINAVDEFYGEPAFVRISFMDSKAFLQ